MEEAPGEAPVEAGEGVDQGLKALLLDRPADGDDGDGGAAIAAAGGRAGRAANGRGRGRGG